MTTYRSINGIEDSALVGFALHHDQAFYAQPMLRCGLERPGGLVLLSSRSLLPRLLCDLHRCSCKRLVQLA